mmetsp:Transcript_30098/g.51222  ORF Transcript_30098/g.51222 Transcript_30098/m.51222 type:complete len:80 (+) Transcript_30098:1554-1793(+)
MAMPLRVAAVPEGEAIATGNLLPIREAAAVVEAQDEEVAAVVVEGTVELEEEGVIEINFLFKKIRKHPHLERNGFWLPA